MTISTRRPKKVRKLGHGGEAHGENKANTRKSKHACIVEAHESTRKRLERTLPKDHEDCNAGKGFNWLGHHNLVHKFMPMHQAMQILDAEAAVDKEREKLEKLPAWQVTKSGTKERSSKRHRKKGGEFILLHERTCAISKTRSWNPSS